jgi:hypothetical protein
VALLAVERGGEEGAPDATPTPVLHTSTARSAAPHPMASAASAAEHAAVVAAEGDPPAA